MNVLITSSLGVLLLIGSCWSDVYLHNPRGSNNRLNERSANRNNANRAFDSQNNNRGGYNVGDQTDQAAGDEDDQYNMKFFQSGSSATGGSTLEIEWTNQHGCGGNEDDDPHKLNCNMVLQYMCQEHDSSKTSAADNFPYNYLRNGRNTNTQNYNRKPPKPTNKKQESRDDYLKRESDTVKKDRVIHESFSWYDKCHMRERNMGLFTADQRIRTGTNGYSSALFTRQNPNGNRRGYECPEERDYYPYWHPSPWVDIAVLTDNITQCERFVRESHNSKPRHECFEKFTSQEWRHYSKWNNQEDCEKEGGVWAWQRSVLEEFKNATTAQACTDANTTAGGALVWGKLNSLNDTMPVCFVPAPPLDCRQGPWSRVNHLGNGREGVPLNYTWRLPNFPTRTDKRCVLRIRYNISTDDYDPLQTDSSQNRNRGLGRRSPVEQNPHVDIGASTRQPLRLAINTAQFGRTFQDRSHVFILRSRDNYMQHQEDFQSVNIRNLNVRGKRGNIVQTFPSVEYDFIPNRLEICPNDLIHVQWTGSNRHNNNNPAGDGQAGDAGEGRGGTDRHNMVESSESNLNYPLPYENTNLWRDAVIYWSGLGEKNVSAITRRDLALAMASSGHYECYQSCRKPLTGPGAEEKLNKLLNNAPASFEGAVLRFTRADQLYHYLCTRNNNFTNRSQKGWIKVRRSDHPQCRAQK